MIRFYGRWSEVSSQILSMQIQLSATFHSRIIVPVLNQTQTFATYAGASYPSNPYVFLNRLLTNANISVRLQSEEDAAMIFSGVCRQIRPHIRRPM